MVNKADTGLNGYRAGIFFDFLRKVEPGAVLFLGATALGFIISINNKQADHGIQLALMARDISTINVRMASESYTPAGAVGVALHQEQMETVHRRMGEIQDGQQRLWDRLNQLADEN